MSDEVRPPAVIELSEQSSSEQMRTKLRNAEDKFKQANDLAFEKDNELECRLISTGSQTRRD